MKADYYVGIEDHRMLRKNILESTKGTIKILQRVELIKKKRELKIQRIVRLKELVKEINFLISNLQKFLPKTNLSEIKMKTKSKKEILEEMKEEKKEERKASKTKKKVTKRKVAKKEELKENKKNPKKATLSTRRDHPAQTTIKQASSVNLKELESELDDIESKLKDLN